MRSFKFPWLLILIVVLPLLFLVWQSLQLWKDDQRLRRMQQEELAQTLLLRVDAELASHFQALAMQWQRHLPDQGLQPQSLRQWVQRDGLIRQVLLLKDGQRVFPHSKYDPSAAEQEAIRRLQIVWRDPQILNRSQSAEQENMLAADLSARTTPIAKRVVQSKQSTVSGASLSERAQSGWFMWHWGQGVNVLFWQQLDEQHRLAIELNMARLKADLIARLPATKTGADADFRIHLLDISGEVLYRWGHYSGAEQPLATSALSYPLASWSLMYFGSQASPSMPRWLLWLSLVGFSVLMAGLAWFFHREYQSEVRLAQQRVNFVSQVSHELKTPLTNIRMYAEMLESQLDYEPRQQHYLQVISNESQRLSRLIANVLNFSRPVQVYRRDMIPDEVILQVLEYFRPGLEAKALTVEADLNAKELIQCDPDALEQILTNLMSNAEKYAAQGQYLLVSSEFQHQWLCIRVRDYGPGIPRAQMKRIFQPFYRIHDELVEGVSGTGIGLTIARQQAELLNGKLVLEEVEQGACFVLYLPVQ